MTRVDIRIEQFSSGRQGFDMKTDINSTKCCSPREWLAILRKQKKR